jgi:hypothetical protein
MQRRKPARYFAFDLLSLNGEDLRRLPLVDHKQRLRRILPARSPHVLYVDHTRENGTELGLQPEGRAGRLVKRAGQTAKCRRKAAKRGQQSLGSPAQLSERICSGFAHFLQITSIKRRPTLPGGRGFHWPSLVNVSITVPLPMLLENQVAFKILERSSPQLNCCNWRTDT